ncbi:DUF2877 domain-containing protein [Morganella psychrotolerans]|uniref:DUF2877 domain-containing protein n=1 Tax=Morganella psychrotolerans TaxID=368603 RepID=A0A1B8HB19_9GAMM|nr:DUF2877 domain-containing protein [Morganella psychrotolerans]OBU06261.1 hypothetical protein AYY18_07150 [Morganella psychrotolerans]
MKEFASHRQVLYGLTADTHFLNLLHQPQSSGKIEQVFNRAINISVNNTLYTLLSSQSDNAPNSCRLINKDFTLLTIEEGDSVRFLNKEIIIGGKYLISFSVCDLWQCTDVIFRRDKLTTDDYLSFLLTQKNNLDVILNSNKQSLFNYSGNNIFYISMSEQFTKLRLNLVELIIKGDRLTLPDVISQFVGLGIGLTPSGDDYLVGLMAFLLLKGHPVSSLCPEFYQSIARSKNRTTSISAITLEKALNREYRENMQQLIQSLADAEETYIHSQFSDILNIGSSSGCDMLFGLRDALYITHYLGEKYVD